MFSSFFSSLRTSAAVGLALAALTGCGGGSDDTVQPPPVSQLAAPADFTLSPLVSPLASPAKFRWTATPGATGYELYVDPDGPGPMPEAKATFSFGRLYVSAPGGSPQESEMFYGDFQRWYSGAALAPDLAASLNATYRLRACDAQGCGAFTAPATYEPSYEFSSGRVPRGSQMSGDGLTLALGLEDSAVRVFRRESVTQPWREDAVLRTGNARFGEHLALSDDGNTLAVVDQVPDTDSRTYIYRRDGGAWVEQASLIPANLPAACGQPCRVSAFDLALSADGSLLAGQVDFESRTTRYAASAVVVYARNGAAWSEQALLGADNRVHGGMALARDGNTLVVSRGGIWDWGSGQSDPSFVQVFIRQGDGAWSQQASIPVGLAYTGFNPYYTNPYDSINQFGTNGMRLSDDGNTLVVQALDMPQDRSGRAIDAADFLCSPAELLQSGSSAVYMAVFARNGSAWQRQAIVPLAPYGFAWALARDGNAFVAGDSPLGNMLFTRSNGTWACP